MNVAYSPREHSVSPVARPEAAQIDLILQRVRDLCVDLSRIPLNIGNCRAALLSLRKLIESIPLAIDEAGVALLRINYAARYVESAEIGAARYEIFLLVAVMRQCLGLTETRFGIDLPPESFSASESANRPWGSGPCIA